MITTKDLSQKFQNETAIIYQDLVFESGKTYALLGASGCGKSTLLNMIAGILTPTTGTVTIDGVVMSGKTQKERDAFRIRNIGYVFQDFKLIDEMTVQDNLDILKLEGIDTSGSDAMLEKLGILALKKRKITRLSGGEKQRVAIARALIKKPAILLADEPTGNLNREIGRKVAEEMIAAAEGSTLIAVTHDDRLTDLFDVTLDMNSITGGGRKDV